MRWSQGLRPDQVREDYCGLCHIEFYTPVFLCWACDGKDGFAEVQDGLRCGRCSRCGLMCDSSCVSVWMKRDVEYTSDEVACVDLESCGRFDHMDEVEDMIIARQRDVEKRKRGIRSHLKV